MTLPLDETLSKLKNTQHYLTSFPRCSNGVKELEQYIFFYEDAFFNIFYNINSESIYRLEHYDERGFSELLEDLSFGSIPGTLLAPYKRIPPSLFCEAKYRKSLIHNIVSKLMNEGNWFCCSDDRTWFIHRNETFSWHRIHVTGEKINCLALSNEAMVRKDIDKQLFNDVKQGIELVPEKTLKNIADIRQQVRKYFRLLNTERFSFVLKENSFLKELKLSIKGSYFHASLAGDRVRTLNEVSSKTVMDDMLDILVRENTLNLYEIPPTLRSSIIELAGEIGR